MHIKAGLIASNLDYSKESEKKQLVQFHMTILLGSILEEVMNI